LYLALVPKSVLSCRKSVSLLVQQSRLVSVPQSHLVLVSVLWLRLSVLLSVLPSHLSVLVSVLPSYPS
jgi:hypothetical protein